MSDTPPEPQSVLAPLTESALFLVLTVKAGGEEAVRDLLPEIAGLRRSVGFRVPSAALSCVVGVGSDVWGRLFDGPRPAGLHPFVELEGARHRAPATPGDLLLHIRSHRSDLCFELAGRLMERLRGAASVEDEVHGFKYFDNRDLLGFVDGTENPEGVAAGAAALVGPEDPGFSGGSYVVVQKYLHDMDGWNALPVEAQEYAMGRTKLEDLELSDEAKPADSHVALNTITEADGTERQIVRLNMPFGSLGRQEFGTYFIGYSGTPEVTEEMLRNMFLGKDSARHDRILDFSTAVTGCLFYVPTADFLDDPPPAPAGRTETAVTPAQAAPPDGPGALDEPAAPPPGGDPSGDPSLRIGSLRTRSL